MWSDQNQGETIGAEPPSGVSETADGFAEAFVWFDFSVEELAYNLSALLVSFVLALPVAWDREQKRSSPGLRTFPLVAMSACAYVLVATSILAKDSEAHSRILQGLATGIGFIGGGAILKSQDRVTGTATAASIWAMGAMGAAIAYRRIEIALLMTVVTLGALRWLKPFKKQDEDDA